MAHRSCRVRANTRHSEKPSSQRIDSLSTDHAVLFGVFMFVSMVISIIITIIIIVIVIVNIIIIIIYDYDCLYFFGTAKCYDDDDSCYCSCCCF